MSEVPAHDKPEAAAAAQATCAASAVNAVDAATLADVVNAAETACLADAQSAQQVLPSAVLMLGIGGMGMAPLAIYLAQAGVTVFGTDDSLQPRVRTLLQEAGAILLETQEVADGFAEGRFEAVELCAISSAISASHRLLSLARSAGLHIVRRGELLARVSRARRLVAVVGSHGKTTTTGLLIAALDRLGIRFDYVLGGLFQDPQRLPARYCGQSLAAGAGENVGTDGMAGAVYSLAKNLSAESAIAAPWLVAEVDESDGTIEHFSPYLTLAVNFDWDHTDRYASASALRETFAALFTRTATGVIFPADDPVLPALVPPAKVLPCEISAAARVRGFNGSNEALARAAVETLLAIGQGHIAQAAINGSVKKMIAGTVPEAANTAAQNAAGITGIEAVSPQPGADANTLQVSAAAELFAGFCGIFRRQEWLFRSAGLQIMTDYAHHPREVAALLDYLRLLNPAGRLVVVFQPHRYTRTRQFAREFAEVLAARSDAFFLMPVYAASETAFAEGRTEAIALACIERRSGSGVLAKTCATYKDAAAALPADGGESVAAAAVADASCQSASAVGNDEGLACANETFSAGATRPADGVQVYPAYAIATQCRDYLNAVVPVAAEAEPVAEETAGEAAVGGGAAPQAATTLVFVGAGDIDALARRIAGDCVLREAWQRELSPQTQVRLGEPLARRTTMRLGGSARFYADPGSVEDVGVLIRLAREAGLPVWLLGRGSNLIVPDEGFDGLVISFNSDAFRRIEPQADGSWYVGSGVALKRLCAQAAREGLSGWEFLDGIPGTIGGALRMNAGAMGKWMFDVVESVDILLPDGTVERRAKAAFNIGYRKCAELAAGGVALGAVIRPDVLVSVDAVREKLDNYASRRKETQPREPSAGCIFKNPEGHHAGALIDELGLKGLRVGGAEVSSVHGNFIINRGEATAGDVLELVRQIRARVREQRSIELEPEALLMGKNWKDVL